MPSEFKRLIKKLFTRKKMCPQPADAGTSSGTPPPFSQGTAQVHPLSDTPEPSNNELILRGARYQLSSTNAIFNSVIPSDKFERWMSMLENVLTFHLYSSASEKPQITFIRIEVANFDGVGYTVTSGTGKLIRISSQYINKIPSTHRYSEISGVVLHEMVHALQYNGAGACPWYFIEGIADYVRLRGGVPNRNWQRSYSSYKGGYSTTAYFLDWLTRKYPDFVKKFNLRLRSRYSDNIPRDLTGKTWDALWNDYKAAQGR